MCVCVYVRVALTASSAIDAGPSWRWVSPWHFGRISPPSTRLVPLSQGAPRLVFYGDDR